MKSSRPLSINPESHTFHRKPPSHSTTRNMNNCFEGIPKSFTRMKSNQLWNGNIANRIFHRMPNQNMIQSTSKSFENTRDNSIKMKSNQLSNGNIESRTLIPTQTPSMILNMNRNFVKRSESSITMKLSQPCKSNTDTRTLIAALIRPSTWTPKRTLNSPNIARSIIKKWTRNSKRHKTCAIHILILITRPNHPKYTIPGTMPSLPNTARNSIRGK
mmetsp:Transcript_1308/g.2722  ORF Transcript_1308/g.2722 Transcript_1308/m.2722 type:complete len:216 (+) Transcript_1308:455-1102(+)